MALKYDTPPLRYLMRPQEDSARCAAWHAKSRHTIVYKSHHKHDGEEDWGARRQSFSMTLSLRNRPQTPTPGTVRSIGELDKRMLWQVIRHECILSESNHIGRGEVDLVARRDRVSTWAPSSPPPPPKYPSRPEWQLSPDRHLLHPCAFFGAQRGMMMLY
jgi:hypothetical protein